MEQSMALQRPNSPVATTGEYNEYNENFFDSIGTRSTFRPNQSLSSKRARLNITFTVNKAAANKTTATLSNEIDFETDYKLILERFIQI
jgi:hypothetical protein